MKKTILIIISILNFSLSIQYAPGQDVLGESITKDSYIPTQMDFASAVKYSLKNNNNIRAMKNALSATEREIGIERSDMMPKLSFNENFTVTNNPTDALVFRSNQSRLTNTELEVGNLNYPGPVVNFLTMGVINQPILNKKEMMEIKVAKKDYSANSYLYLRHQEDLVSQVAQAYLKVLTNQKLIDIIELSIKNLQHHLETAELRNKSNKGLYSDILRAKAALALREEKLITEQRNLNVSKRNLGLLLGLESPVDVTNSIPEIKLQNVNYYKAYSSYRNDLKAYKIRVESAKYELKAAQAEWYPTLNAYASYNFYDHRFPFGGEGNSYITGANFRWEIFDGNKRKYEILQAKDKEAEAKEYLEGLRKKINFKIYEAYLNIEEHQKKLDLAISVHKIAEEDMLSVEKSWENSQLPFVSLIDAQDNLDKAGTNVIINQYDLNEDLINLCFESGITYQELALK